MPTREWAPRRYPVRYAVPPGKWPLLNGLFIGGCVERGDGSSFRRRAHAHNVKGTAYYGWICIRSARRVMTATGRPSTLFLHEYAHLMTPDHGHDAAWRAAITGLGRPAEAERMRRRRKDLTPGDGRLMLDGHRQARPE
jgi:hypothetical protein